MKWGFKFSCGIDRAASKNKKPTGARYFMDETIFKVKRAWSNLYRAVDELRNAVDYLLIAKKNFENLPLGLLYKLSDQILCQKKLISIIAE